MGGWGIRDVRVCDPGEGIRPGWVWVEGGRVRGVGEGEPPAGVGGGGEWMEGEGCLLTPGLIDLHTHGIERWSYDGGAAAVREGLACLAKHGTTCVLPTVVPREGDEGEGRLGEIAAAAGGVDAVCVPGLHLEGPFVALPGAGVSTWEASIRSLDRLVGLCGGAVRAMSISPETPGALGVIARLAELGVAAFVTHTRATVEQAMAAVEAGARHATHFYDVFPAPAETDPGVRPAGVVEVFLGDGRTTVDFIGDGVHVHPAVIRMAVRCMGAGRVSLITDSNIGAGLPAGEYETPWARRIRVDPADAARIVTPRDMAGMLAGSSLTMERGMRNLLAWLQDMPEHEVWALGTRSPACAAGLHGKGRLCEGADADLVLWRDGLEARRTWVSGRLVYESA